jgi:hypothetical protein
MYEIQIEWDVMFEKYSMSRRRSGMLGMRCMRRRWSGMLGMRCMRYRWSGMLGIKSTV